MSGTDGVRATLQDADRAELLEDRREMRRVFLEVRRNFV
jgi:hypothetical protein